MTEGRECGKRSFPAAHALIVRRICGFEGVLSLPFLDSSMVEHSAVNRRVVGSSPTRGVQMNKKPADYSAVKATRKGRCSCYSGPMVKRLRHRPFTAVTAVRICLGSFQLYTGRHGQAVRHGSAKPLSPVRFRVSPLMKKRSDYDSRTLLSFSVV